MPGMPTHPVDAYGDLMSAEGFETECDFEDGECVCGRREGQPTAEEQERAAVLEAAQEAADAAYGDSNDDEIEALRNALELALGLIGMTMPDPSEED